MTNEDKFDRYKDKFTLDGRVKTVTGVTPDKVKAVGTLIERTMQGDRIADGTLKEALASTDAIFNLSHVTALNVLADFDLQPRTSDALGATTLTVQDFRPATLYSLRPDWSGTGVLGDGGNGSTPRWIAPRVPEAANYPYAFMEQEVNQQVGGVVKRGFKTGFTFESYINDSVGFIQALPNSMRDIALDTDDWEIWNALISGVDSTEQLQGGAIPDSTETPTANAPFSRAALIRAIIELGQRELNGRKIVVSGGFKLVIPAGQSVWVNYILNNVDGPVALDDGSFTFTINGYNPLSNIEVIESEYVADNSWYLIPNQNAARRPLLQLMRLVGHDVPELRVQGNTGNYVGGGLVNPFEGSFDNDSADFRLRMFTKGILWTPSLIVWSTGAGS